MRHFNIPIFIPMKACPHQCIYCNQNYISGQQHHPTIDEIKRTIDEHLSTFPLHSNIQVAFFGGTFTGLSMEQMAEYLDAVQPYIKDGKVDSIRLSTRPDYINKEILDLLKAKNVKDIELGAQSLDEDVLQKAERGHTVEDVEKASRLINMMRFSLGLQMMIGLPGDSLDKSIMTAKRIVALGAKSTRIYPTLVVAKTPLAKMYEKGEYSPLTILDAVQWAKRVYEIFADAGVKVLRVGLHPSKDLLNGKGYIAGPFHVSFFELVKTSLWWDKLKEIPENTKEIIVNPSDINHAIGYSSRNLKKIRERLPQVKFVQDKTIPQGTYICNS